MNFKRFITGFITVFPITLIVTIGVTFLWSMIFNEVAQIDWETSFLLAIIIGIITPVIDARKNRPDK